MSGAEWTWVRNKGWRQRAEQSGLTLREYLDWPNYLNIDQVLTLTGAGLTLFEYRRRVRALGKVVRAKGGQSWDVAQARNLLVPAAKHNYPFPDLLAAVQDGVWGEAIELAIKSATPIWFAVYAFDAEDAPARPSEVRRLYQRLVTYKGSGPDLVRAVVEEFGEHREVRPWANLGLTEEAVVLLIQAKISVEEVRANPALGHDLDGLRTLIALTGGNGRLGLLRAA